MWIITALQHVSPEVTVKGFKKCCVSNAMDEPDDGMLGVSVRKINTLTVKMETVTLIGKDT